MALCCFPVSSLAQQETTPSPTVTAFDCPKYPSKAESVKLQGMVVLQVTTDGHQVVNVKVTSGHPFVGTRCDQERAHLEVCRPRTHNLCSEILLRQRGPFQARQGYQVLREDGIAKNRDR